MCRSHDRFTLDIPRIHRAYLFFWESSRREGGFTACWMVNISMPALRCSVIPTQGCSYLGISRLFSREKRVIGCRLSVFSRRCLLSRPETALISSRCPLYPYYIAGNNRMSKKILLLAISLSLLITQKKTARLQTSPAKK